MIELWSTFKRSAKYKMIRNVYLKKILKKSVFKMASLINIIIPKNDKIVLLYSANGGIEFSLIPLRRYLIEHDYIRRYRIICGVKNLEYADETPLEYKGRIASFFLFFRAKHVFYTAGQIPIKPTKKQIVIHLSHGAANLKTMGHLSNINNGDEFFFTYMIATSPLYKEIIMKEYMCTEKNVVVIGDPVIDTLLNEKSAEPIFRDFSKMILWLPTFRQSDYLGYDDSTMENLVPLFSENEYEKINTKLAKYNIKMIVKIHPAQRNIYEGKRHFSHFEIYTHDEFVQKGYNVNRLMAQADVLLGDYSSASMQFLIFDRPQAFIVPDIDEYSKKRGFVFDNPEEYMGGAIVKNKRQFWEFIEEIVNNIDSYKRKRREVCDKLYSFKDNRNCERIIKLSKMK